MTWIEIFGYCGSVLVAISLMMKSIKKLRWINLVGAGVFSTYGLLVSAYPVFILNGFIVLVDVYYLLQMRSKDDYFTFLKINSSAMYLTKFVEFYLNDIKKFFPAFNNSIFEKNENILILRNLLPVGIVSYFLEDNNIARIELDYAIPDYRDLKNAHYILSCESGFFKQQGVEVLKAKAETNPHKWYLKKIGFNLTPGSQTEFEKKLCT